MPTRLTGQTENSYCLTSETPGKVTVHIVSDEGRIATYNVTVFEDGTAQLEDGEEVVVATIIGVTGIDELGLPLRGEVAQMGPEVMDSFAAVLEGLPEGLLERMVGPESTLVVEEDPTYLEEGKESDVHYSFMNLGSMEELKVHSYFHPDCTRRNVAELFAINPGNFLVRPASDGEDKVTFEVDRRYAITDTSIVFLKTKLQFVPGRGWEVLVEGLRPEGKYYSTLGELLRSRYKAEFLSQEGVKRTEV